MIINFSDKREIYSCVGTLKIHFDIKISRIVDFATLKRTSFNSFIQAFQSLIVVSLLHRS